LEEDPEIHLIDNLAPEAGAPINVIAYEDIAIGTLVQVVFEKTNDETTLPRWITRNSATENTYPNRGQVYADMDTS
jgi:hypothetical protein